MSIRLTTYQRNLIEHTLQTLYERSGAYAARVAGLSLTDEEQNLLREQHRKTLVALTMGDIESCVGGIEVIRDPTEGACP
jgi:hypothetical protein